MVLSTQLGSCFTVCITFVKFNILIIKNNRYLKSYSLTKYYEYFIYFIFLHKKYIIFIDY